MKKIERNETHAINEITDGEPIAIRSTKRHHLSFSYAIKREYMRYFLNQFANNVAENFDFDIRI